MLKLVGNQLETLSVIPKKISVRSFLSFSYDLRKFWDFRKFTLPFQEVVLKISSFYMKKWEMIWRWLFLEITLRISNWLPPSFSMRSSQFFKLLCQNMRKHAEICQGIFSNSAFFSRILAEQFEKLRRDLLLKLGGNQLKILGVIHQKN